MYDAAAIGELLIDFTYQTKDDEGYPTMAAHPGGAPANFLAALARFGARTAMLGKVGDDTFGRLLVRTLKERGIETRGIRAAKDCFTTLAFVTLDEKGDREFAFARKPGADTRLREDELDLRIIEQTRALHFGTLSLTDEPSRSATYRAVDYAKERGKLISFDPNLREPLWQSMDEAREQMLWGLGRADVVKLSEEEGEFLFGTDAGDTAEKLIRDLGVKLVFVTRGAAGCLYATRSVRGEAPALAGIKTVDTTGAGDIFGGSALFGLLKTGKRPEELEEREAESIARFACAAAGLSTTRSGGISSVPEYAQVMEACGNLW